MRPARSITGIGDGILARRRVAVSGVGCGAGVGVSEIPCIGPHSPRYRLGSLGHW